MLPEPNLTAPPVSWAGEEPVAVEMALEVPVALVLEVVAELAASEVAVTVVLEPAVEMTVTSGGEVDEG